MSKFVINADYSNSKTVEAHSFEEEGSLIIFRTAVTGRGNQVYALPISEVRSIERVQE